MPSAASRLEWRVHCEVTAAVTRFVWRIFVFVEHISSPSVVRRANVVSKRIALQGCPFRLTKLEEL